MPSPEPADDSSLDQPCGVSTEVAVLAEDGKTITMVPMEMTFRELQQLCEREIRLWDSLEPRDRATVQRDQDKNWKPIQPYEGLRRRPRRY